MLPVLHSSALHLSTHRVSWWFGESSMTLLLACFCLSWIIMMNADYQNSGHLTNGWMDRQMDIWCRTANTGHYHKRKNDLSAHFPFFNGIWSRESSVSVAIRPWAVRAESQGLIPGKAGKRPDWYWNSVSFLLNTSRGFFLRGWSTNVITHLHLLARSRMYGAIPPFRHTSLWCT